SQNAIVAESITILAEIMIETENAIPRTSRTVRHRFLIEFLAARESIGFIKPQNMIMFYLKA
ncbi:MAG: hypothetical protein ACFFB3_02095, partial [Candidatus Hodarchaeota archaeon]